jgi:hypothetical protein
MPDLDLDDDTGDRIMEVAEFATEQAGEPPEGQKCECPGHFNNMLDADIFEYREDDETVLMPGKEEPLGTASVFTRRKEDGKVCVWWYCDLCAEQDSIMGLDEWVGEEGWPDDGSGNPEAPDRCLVQEG